MTRPHRIQTCLIAALLPACLMLGACNTTPTKSDTNYEQLNPNYRRAEAIKHMQEGERLADDDKIEEAIEAYKLATQSDDRLYGAWNNMGELLMRQQNYADAVAAFNIAAEIERLDPRPFYNAGVAYQTIGWAEDSLLYFERALERDPSYLPALRGAVKASDMLSRADERTMDHVRRGLLREDDPVWRAYFERQRYRVENALRTQNERDQ